MFFFQNYGSLSTLTLTSEWLPCYWDHQGPKASINVSTMAAEWAAYTDDVLRALSPLGVQVSLSLSLSHARAHKHTHLHTRTHTLTHLLTYSLTHSLTHSLSPFVRCPRLVCSCLRHPWHRAAQQCASAPPAQHMGVPGPVGAPVKPSTYSSRCSSDQVTHTHTHTHCVSVCLSVCLSACLPACLPVCLSVCLTD